MSNHNSLRHRVAKALYENTRQTIAGWDALPEERKIGWLSDADEVIPIIVKACCMIVDQPDPEKPNSYLFRRENLSSVIEGLFLGAPDDEWECPLQEPDCTKNCGSHGCGN